MDILLTILIIASLAGFVYTRLNPGLIDDFILIAVLAFSWIGYILNKLTEILLFFGKDYTVLMVGIGILTAMFGFAYYTKNKKQGISR